MIILRRNNGGLVKFVILIVIAILVLSYFSIDLKGVVESPQAQSNFGYVGAWIQFVWREYLSRPVLYFWNDIFLNLLWSSFVSNLEQIKRGEPNNLIKNPPQVPM